MIRMTVKTTFHITLSDGNKRNDVGLKRENYLSFVPIEGMKIRIDFKKKVMKDVVYDLNKDTFIVELKEDDSLILGLSNSTIEQLTEDYLEKGWERLVPSNRKEKVKNSKISYAIATVEQAKFHVGNEARIEKMSEAIINSGLTEREDIERVFDETDVSYDRRISVLKIINTTSGTEYEIPSDKESFHKLLDKIKNARPVFSGNAFIDKVSEFIVEFGIEEKENIHQVFYFAGISPEKGKIIKERIKTLRKEK